MMRTDVVVTIHDVPHVKVSGVEAAMLQAAHKALSEFYTKMSGQSRGTLECMSCKVADSPSLMRCMCGDCAEISITSSTSLFDRKGDADED